MDPSCSTCGMPLPRQGPGEGICPRCAFSAAVELGEPDDELNEMLHLVSGLEGIDRPTLIGRGAMGVVFRSGDRAIKVLSGRLALDPEFEKRFRQEAGVLARLDHPNLVKVYRTGVVGDFPYFIMEHVEGTTLRRLMRSTPLEPRRALKILLQVVEAVAAAHRQGVIHRDIKPENILIGPDDAVKVADFGIAQWIERDPERLTTTLAPIAAGTPAYMAPELFDDPRRIDPATDVYSLGVLAYELLTRSLPLGHFPPPSVRASLDDRFDALILAALEPHPPGRIASAEALLQAFRGIVEERTPRIPWRLRAKRLAASRLFAALIVGSVVESCLLAAIAVMNSTPDPERLFDRLVEIGWSSPESIANTTFVQADGSGTRQPLKEHLALVQFLLRALSDDRIAGRVERLLAREGNGTDMKRAALAVRTACSLNKESGIDPERRVRVLVEEFSSLAPSSDLATMFMRPNLIKDLETRTLTAIDQAGPAVGPFLLERLLSGTLAPSGRVVVAAGLARWAEPPEIREMLRVVKEGKDQELRAILAHILIGRLSLPQPSLGSLGMKDETYMSRLPELIDPEHLEALWEPSVQWALEFNPDDFHFGLHRWRSALMGNDRPSWAKIKSASPPEYVAGMLKDVRWPLDEDSAARLERDVLVRHDSEHPFLRVLLLHWHKTGRLTIPRYRYPDVTPQTCDRLETPLNHEWARDTARAMLGPLRDPSTLAWESFMIHQTLTKPKPILVHSLRGRGRVEISELHEIDAPRYADRIRVGVMTTAVPVRSTQSFWRQEDSGRFFSKGNGWSYDGNHRWGSDLATVPKDPAEMIAFLNSNVGYGLDSMKLLQFEGTRYGFFCLLLADPHPFGSPESRWRRAAAGVLQRAAEQKGFWGCARQMVSVAALCPIPEGRTALRAIWENRSSFKPESRPETFAAGAALLLLGDPQPMNDAPDLWSELPDAVRLRICLFSPNEEIRRAAEPHASIGMCSRAELEQVSEILAEQSPQATSFRNGVDAALSRRRHDERWILLREAFFPTGLASLAVLAGAWLPDRRSLRAFGISLVTCGLLFRMIVLEGPDRIWLPQAGDVLVGLGLLAYGGWILKVLGLGLAAMGIASVARVDLYPATTMLFSAAMMILTLDILGRHLPRRIKWFVGIAALITWWLILVPAGVGSAWALLTSVPPTTPRGSLTGWPTLLLLAPFVFLIWARLALPTPPIADRVNRT